MFPVYSVTYLPGCSVTTPAITANLGRSEALLRRVIWITTRLSCHRSREQRWPWNRHSERRSKGRTVAAGLTIVDHGLHAEARGLLAAPSALMIFGEAPVAIVEVQMHLRPRFAARAYTRHPEQTVDREQVGAQSPRPAFRGACLRHRSLPANGSRVSCGAATSHVNDMMASFEKAAPAASRAG